MAHPPEIRDATVPDSRSVQRRLEEPLNLLARSALILEHWKPETIGDFNGQELKLTLLLGEFVWHCHDDADELFIGVYGRVRIERRDWACEIGPGDVALVPRGIEHRTVAERDAVALIISPMGTRNTGNVVDAKFTVPVVPLDDYGAGVDGGYGISI